MVDAGRIVRWGLGGFVGIVALEHLLRRDLPPADHFVSEYAVGWTHPLQAVAFVAWAAATAGCTVLAARVNERRIARAIVVLGLVAATAGLCLAAVFSTQTVAGELPAGVQRTTAGRLHDFGTLAILAGLLVAALASLRLLRPARYRLTVAALGVALVAIVPALVAVGWDAPGIGQRGFIAVGLAWQWVFARSVARRGVVRA